MARFNGMISQNVTLHSITIKYCKTRNICVQENFVDFVGMLNPRNFPAHKIFQYNVENVLP